MDIIKDVQEATYNLPCPTCQGPLHPLDIDVQTDSAKTTVYCPECEKENKTIFY